MVEERVCFKYEKDGEKEQLQYIRNMFPKKEYDMRFMLIDLAYTIHKQTGLFSKDIKIAMFDPIRKIMRVYEPQAYSSLKSFCEKFEYTEIIKCWEGAKCQTEESL